MLETMYVFQNHMLEIKLPQLDFQHVIWKKNYASLLAATRVVLYFMSNLIPWDAQMDCSQFSYYTTRRQTAPRDDNSVGSQHTCVHARIGLLSLPVRLGGLGLINPSATSDDMLQASVKLTAPLVAIIATQDQTRDVNPDDILSARKEIRVSNRQHSEDQANAIYSQLTPQLKRCVDLAKERGASSWLSVLPLSEQGFHLHKGEFRDALCLRYGWTLSNTHRLCNCGKAFTIDHAMVCHMGGFPRFATTR